MVRPTLTRPQRSVAQAGLCLLLAGAGALAASPVAGAGAGAPPARAGEAGARSAFVHDRGPRVGGSVRRAWPKTGAAPRKRQARWLARQVGSTGQRTCARQWSKARIRCHLTAKRSAAGAGAAPATLSVASGDRGSPRGESLPLASAAAIDMADIKLPLQLIRSYEIPADDPAYKRLLNWSWTYDSAVAAAAFTATGDKANATQLLDQLAALQYSDGSLEIAFNTATGEGARVFRTGTVAWAGLAAATYDRTFDSSRYLGTEQRTADFLLSLQRNTGLIPGGPDVIWISTQHNLITFAFLVGLAKELTGTGDTKSAAFYTRAARTIGASIDENLLVVDAEGARFRQGVNDDTQAFDVQALGAMYLHGTGRPELAAQVLEYADKTFAVAHRSVKLSAERESYNMTYESKGPFDGFTPYAGGGEPVVRWADASGEMRLARATLGQDTDALDRSIARWATITDGAGPPQADRAVRSEDGDTEYHVWPAATAAAWTVLSQSAPAFFAAPLDDTTALVTDWTRVRGGNLITTYPDGRLALAAGAERRALTGSAKAADYTVTANTTQAPGASHGVYVRATVDNATKLTAYCVQLDRGYGAGEIVVREILSDVELAVPLARSAVPSGFAWYDTPHVIAVTVVGNTMTVRVDKAQVITIPDLAAASARSVKYTYPDAPKSPPLAGGYGLRAWGNGLVTLQQMTVGPAG